MVKKHFRKRVVKLTKTVYGMTNSILIVSAVRAVSPVSYSPNKKCIKTFSSRSVMLQGTST